MSAAIICPRCGGGDCVIPTEEVLESIASMYAACQSCAARSPDRQAVTV